MVQGRRHPVGAAAMNQHAVDTNIDARAEHAAILNLPGQRAVVIGAAAGNAVDQQGGIRAGTGALGIELGFQKLLPPDDANFSDFLALCEQGCGCDKQERRNCHGKN